MSLKAKAMLVKPHFSLVLKQEEKTLVDHIMAEIAGIDLSKSLLDPEFLLYIAELIENQVNTKTGGSQKGSVKMDIFVEILKKVFAHIKPEEIEYSKGILEFLLRRQLVKKTKTSSLLGSYLKKKFGSV